MYNEFITNLVNEMNETTTHNNAKTYKSSLSKNVDFFSNNYRYISENEIKADFIDALAEDEDLALANFLNNTDIRGGKGERRTTRTILDLLSKNGYFNPILFSILSELSRYDVIVHQAIINKDEVLCKMIANQLSNEFDGITKLSLLAKWMPSINAGNKARELSREFISIVNWSPTKYRGILTKLRKQLDIVEHYISTKQFDKIDYSKVPSVAFKSYTPLFKKHDEVRFNEFIAKVNKGESKLNASVLYPYQIMAKYGKDTNIDEFIALWNNQKDINIPKGINILPVMDFSGSMWGLPIQNSRSLGLYLARHNHGAFKNIIVEFNDKSNFIKLSDDLKLAVQQINNFDAVGSTDIDAVFTQILDATLKSEDKSSCPQYIVMVSDMEFNECTDNQQTNFESWKAEFNKYELTLPTIIFWNVGGDNHKPVKKDTHGTMLISGFSVNILENLFNIENITPYSTMLSVLSKYQPLVDLIKKNKK